MRARCRIRNRLDWNVADGRVTEASETAIEWSTGWSPVVVASSVSDDHWAAKIDPASMGLIAS